MSVSDETMADLLGVVARCRAEVRRLGRLRREREDLPAAVAVALDQVGTAMLELAVSILRARQGITR